MELWAVANSISTADDRLDSERQPGIPWRRVGDIGLAFSLVLFAMMRGYVTVQAANDGDWFAAIHHGVVGIALSVMAVLPIIRGSAIARGKGFMPKAIALIGGYIIIPMGALSLTWRPDWLLTVTTAGIIALTAVEVWALMTLRRSFSVFPEARKLVVHGPYGYVRHPLYAIYIVSYVLVALPRIGLLALLLATLGIAAQVMRSKREEEVLRSAFPEYDNYAARVPAFFPRPGRTEAPAHHGYPSQTKTSDSSDEALAA
jgi:protein-S-isoprenylcysteine O-methyltransferase Ste14